MDKGLHRASNYLTKGWGPRKCISSDPGRSSVPRPATDSRGSQKEGGYAEVVYPWAAPLPGEKTGQGASPLSATTSPLAV